MRVESVATLGPYELGEEIGRGGIGRVFRALDTVLNREVAIKVLREDLARDPGVVGGFIQEARYATAINHPHIGRVFGLGQVNGCKYLVMELLLGRALDQIIAQDGPVPEERVLHIAHDVARALNATYEFGLIHGDIKPANIFVTQEAGAKVLDFGLARLANIGLCASDGVWGSPCYISPERVSQTTETEASDIYSLGATLFHALTGVPPFDGSNHEDVALKRLTEEPLPVRALNPHITARTERMVDRMLNKSRELRYGDYDALLADLSQALKGPFETKPQKNKEIT